MDTETIAIMVVLVTPLYGLLVAINRRIGVYDEICKDVKRLETRQNAVYAVLINHGAKELLEEI